MSKLKDKKLGGTSGGLDFGGAVNIKNAREVSLNDTSSSEQSIEKDVVGISHINRSHRDTQVHSGLTDMVSKMASATPSLGE